jgi:hypothetical protein
MYNLRIIRTRPVILLPVRTWRVQVYWGKKKGMAWCRLKRWFGVDCRYRKVWCEERDDVVEAYRWFDLE